MKTYPRLSILLYLGIALFGDSFNSLLKPKTTIEVHMTPYVLQDEQNPRYGVVFHTRNGGIFYAEEGAANRREDGSLDISLGELEKKMDCFGCHNLRIVPENLFDTEGREYRPFVHK